MTVDADGLGAYPPTMSPAGSAPCLLALEDGTVYTGTRFGAPGTSVGEVVFNTSMVGYQEILTDPSYCGQMVAMTYPHIGNYGMNAENVESDRPHVRGFIVREPCRQPNHARSEGNLDAYLNAHGVTGIEGIDTRALTRRLRTQGTLRGALTTEHRNPSDAVDLARSAAPMIGADLVQEVAPKHSFDWTPEANSGRVAATATASPEFRVVALDCGTKRSILRNVIRLGCSVRVMPPTVDVAEVLAESPDGVLVGNGPGDPAALSYAINLLRGLVGRVPLFGICLGHQLLSLAMGAESYKLQFGHRGANHPVLQLGTGKVEITSQNHGFAIREDSLVRAGAQVSHRSLNDGTVEGFVRTDVPVFGIQYHPEAAPGPRDAAYAFNCFALMMRERRGLSDADFEAAQVASRGRA